MTPEPLVTIVTPSYNQGRFIRATIDSVLAQTYPHVEYLVVDGGSTDETVSILQEFGDRISWVSEPDRGQAHAINKGFRRARGEIVNWLNSDDLLVPDAAAIAVAELAAQPNAAFVYGDAYAINEDGYIITGYQSPDPNPWVLANAYDYIVQPSAFFRRSALADVGWVDESWHWAMDWDIFMRLSLAFDSVHIGAIMAYARLHDASKSSSGGLARLAEVDRFVRMYSERRLSSAFFVCALDTVRENCNRTIRRATAALGLDPYVPCLVVDTVLAPLGGKLAFRQSLQADGWAGREVNLFERCEGEVLELRGDVPALFDQQLEVCWDGRRLGRWRIPPGRFTLAIPVDADGPRRGILGLRASRSFVGRRRRLSRDSRRLAYRLDSVRWRAVDDIAIWHSEGHYADGWAAPIVRMALRREGPTLRVRGHVPQFVGHQRLEVRCDEGLAASERLAPGPFEVRVPVAPGPGPVDVELLAANSVTLPENPPRSVGYLLDEVGWLS